MRTLGATMSHISSPEVSACPAESVDEEACCAGTTSWVSTKRCWTFSLEEGVLRQPLSGGLPGIPSREHKYFSQRQPQ